MKSIKVNKYIIIFFVCGILNIDHLMFLKYPISGMKENICKLILMHH